MLTFAKTPRNDLFFSFGCNDYSMMRRSDRMGRNDVENG